MRVLVLEDEPLLAMLLEQNLTELGYSLAGSAATVPQALALLDEQAIDCALLDWSLGDDETSLPVARRLRQEGRPFCFLSGHSSLEASPLIDDAPLLTKPVRLEELDSALKAMAGLD
jgi:DNA-binding response OmpR family regulator